MLVQNISIDSFTEIMSLTKGLSYLGGDVLVTLTATKDKLTLEADTAGVQIKTEIVADVKKSGRVLLNIEHLQAIWLKAKKMSIESANKGKIEIKCGRSKYTLSPASGEPHKVKIPTPDKKKTVQLPLSVLKRAIQYTWFSHEEDGSGDLRIIIKKKKLVTETSDTIKAVVCTTPMPLWNNKEPLHAVLKKHAVNVIMNSFKPDLNVWLDTTSSNIRVYTDNSLISIPLVASTELVAVSKMLSSILGDEKSEFSFKVQATDLSDIAKAAANVASKMSKLEKAYVILKVNKTRDRLLLTTKGDVNTFSTSMKITDFIDNTKKKDEHILSVLSKHLRDLTILASRTGEYLDFDVRKKLIILCSTEGNCVATYYFPKYQ